MAAPSGTTWGSTVGGYGRIGIYTSLSSTDTETTLKVEVWFWSKYSVSDSNNTYYYNNRASSGSATNVVGSVSINTTVDSGGWSTSNQKKLGAATYKYTRGTSAQTRYLYAKLTGVDRVGGTMYASKTVSIPKLASYTVTYNANGGTGAPADQTKWYGTALTLSSTVPTRTGYTFVGWGSSATDTTPINQPGGTYTGNAAYTYYAIWKPYTHTVRFDANGGSNAPVDQIKQYGVAMYITSSKPSRTGYTFSHWNTAPDGSGTSYTSGQNYLPDQNGGIVTLYAIWTMVTYLVSYDANSGTNPPETQVKEYWTNLTISSVIPTKTDYNFKGWTTSPTSISVVYNPGDIYTANANITLYAVWELAYVKPRITNVNIIRCNEDGNATEEGSYLHVKFNWATDYEVDLIRFEWKQSAESDYLNFFEMVFGDASDKYRGSVDTIIGSGRISPDFTYDFVIKIADTVGRSEKIITVPSAIFPLDMLGGGKGISFGKAAELEDYADFAFKIKARQTAEFDDALTVAKKSTFSEGLDAKVINATEKSGFSGGIDTSTLNAYSIELFHATPYIDFHFGEDGGDYTSRIIEYERGKLSTGNWKIDDTLTLGGVAHTGKNKILWAASSLLTASDTISLPEAISAQPHGIVLVFSCYSTDTVQDWGWTTHIIPKSFVASHPGGGMDIPLMRVSASVVGAKYIYVNDTTLKGHADNVATGTAATGVKYNNSYWVLRYVIGI